MKKSSAQNWFLYLSLYLLAVLVVAPQLSWAADDDILYPELEVTPRASKRLQIEAQKEKKERNNWFAHTLPIQSSALMTLISGIYISNNKPVDTKNPQKEKDAGDAASIGMLVGAAWLGFTSYVHFTYTPYQDGWNEVKRIKAKNKREVLTRERMAEEKITGSGSFGRKMSWFSFLTQFPVSAYMASKGENEAAAVGAISSLVAIIPIFIDTHWEGINKTHQEYKKKIYGPVAQGMFIPTPGGRDLVPGYGITMSF